MTILRRVVYALAEATRYAYRFSKMLWVIHLFRGTGKPAFTRR